MTNLGLLEFTANPVFALRWRLIQVYFVVCIFHCREATPFFTDGLA